jgi:hypothetical protein
MEEAFIIMQIGDPELDRICDDIIVPSIQSAGLVARRVDRDNAGDLLKAEIVAFLERSRIIVADLTNERPNCYLEVGYAMGLGKKPNLILMAREDHHHTSPNYRADGPRVHFDLEGYDLLLWDPAEPDKFRAELETRIKRRLALLEPAAQVVVTGERPQPRSPELDSEWLDQHRAVATHGVEEVGRSAYMEAVVTIQPKGGWRQRALLKAIEDAQVRTFGWPIGIVLNQDPHRPHPTADGVEAEVAIGPETEDQPGRRSYDYWHLRQTGDFYFLHSLFEDERAENQIFVDTRVVRTTELLLFLSRLYSRLEVPDDTRLRITVTYSGLKGRRLTVANPARLMSGSRETSEDSATTTVECSVAELQSDLEQKVRELLEPLFMLFDFFELSDQVWREIIDDFVEGRIR